MKLELASEVVGRGCPARRAFWLVNANLDLNIESEKLKGYFADGVFRPIRTVLQFRFGWQFVPILHQDVRKNFSSHPFRVREWNVEFGSTASGWTFELNVER